MSITAEERIFWRNYLERPGLFWGPQCITLRLLNSLEEAEAHAAEAERQRDRLLAELLDHLAQWDGEWCPPMEYSEPGETYTKEEAVKKWLTFAAQKDGA